LLSSRYFLIAGLASALFGQPVLSAEDWDLCRIPSFSFLPSEITATDETLIEGQNLIGQDSESIRLTGNASVTRAQQKITADEILFNKATEQISARGDVEFADTNYRLQSPSVQIDNRNDSATFDQPVFELRGRHVHGEADKIQKLDQHRSRFSELTYTSCDPGDRDWHLRVSELEIDNESGLGSATHARIYFQETPFLYLPYFRFPIDDRRMSGILTPSIGYDEFNGTSLIVPIYWNMAPNYDMTITPASFGKRGLQLNTENRYLFESHQGMLDLSYLDDDKTDDSRWFRQWQHDASLFYDVKAGLLLAEVSDDDFFDDFKSVAPEYNDTVHLERHVIFSRRGKGWNGRLLWQNFQTIEAGTATVDRPYDRLPSFAFEATPEPWVADLYTPIYLETTRFDRDDSVIGTRTHFVSSFNWEASRSWYYFKPELQLAFTDYQLDDTDDDDSIQRALPTLSIDSGLIFEREAGSSGQWLQTLEPRLYFLNTPFDDQDDIPDFDTALNTLTYNNLFDNNRFNGADRIGDAKQVTLGLASRIFDNDSGGELLNARIGQIFFFEDRRVSLDGNRDEASKSDAIGELDIWPLPGLKLAARTVYDEDQSELSNKEFSASYADNGLAANIGYFFSEDVVEQALVSIVYPVNERWTLIAKYQRSLLFDRTVENMLGLNYESCCWGLKILAGQRAEADDDFAELDNSIYFELTLKGLSQVGDDIDQKLANAIPGYRPGF